MNRAAAAGLVLSISAAAGVTTGALLHNVNGTPTASARTTPPPTTPAPTQATSPPTSTPPPSTSTSTTTLPTTTTTTVPTTTATTMSGPKPWGLDLLLLAKEYTMVGLEAPRLLSDHPGQGQAAISACMAGGPEAMEGFDRMLMRDVDAGNGSAAQYLIELESENTAAQAASQFDGWRNCSGDYPRAKETFAAGPVHGVTLPGEQEGQWWQTKLFDDDRTSIESYALVRDGIRVSIVVVRSDSLRRASDMVALTQAVAARMADVEPTAAPSTTGAQD